nr:hypothetical protein [Tanacetum cinerariifolium]
MVKETSDDPSPAKRSKPGLLKKCKPTSSLRLVDEFVDKGVPEKEPGFDDEEANLQRAVEESLNDVHFTHRGPLPPVVFREPDSGRQSSEEMSNIVVLGTKSSGQDEKQGGPDPSDSTDSRPLPSQDILTCSSIDPMDEGFTTTSYLNTTTETKAESMMSVTIQQDTSTFPSMTTQVIDLTSRPDSPNAHQPLPATATETTTTTTTTRPPPSQPTKKEEKRHDSPKTPPGFPPHQPPLLPPPTGPYETSGSSGDSGSSQVAPRPPPPLSTNQKASALASTYAPPSENSLPAQISDMATFMDWYHKQKGIIKLKYEDLEGPAFEIVKVFHPNVIHLQYQIEE